MFTFPVGFFSGERDPFWGNVVLYLPLTGTSGQTTFTDVSQYGHAVTRNGDTVISTAQFPSLTGVNSSAYFDGSGDYLSISSSTVFNLGAKDSTIEVFFRANSFASAFNIVSRYAVSSTASGWVVRVINATTLRLVRGNDTFNDFSIPTLTINTWYHLAFTRSGTTGRFFIDGSQVGTTTVNNFTDAISTTVQIGRTHTITDDFPGYFSHLRITESVARYTANFTPPTAPFPIS